MLSRKVLLGCIMATLFLFLVSSGMAEQDILGTRGHSVQTNESAYTKTSTATSYPNIRLTNNSGSSENPRIACDANYCYVVWQDNRDGNYEIYWRKIDHNGSDVIGDTRVTNTSGNSVVPAISTDGSGNSFIVWQEGTPWGTVYFTRLDGTGARTTTDKALTDGLCLRPAIATLSSGISNIVWERRAPAIHYLLYNKLDVSGNKLCTDIQLSNFDIVDTDKFPSIACDVAGNSYITWRDMNNWNDGIWLAIVGPSCNVTYPSTQYYSSSSATFPDIASTSVGNVELLFQNNDKVFRLWSRWNACQLSQGSSSSQKPSVGIDGTDYYALWQDHRDGNWEIYFSQLPVSGLCNSLTGDVRVTNDPNTSQNPDLFLLGPDDWFAVWQDDRDGNNEVYFTTRQVQGVYATVLIQKDATTELPAESAKVFHNHAGSWHEESQTTDNNGRIFLTDLQVGDLLRAEKLVDQKASVKHPGSDIEPWRYELYLDSDTIREDGTVGSVMINSLNDLTVYLVHSLIKYNLVVSFEWDIDGSATAGTLGNFVAGLRKASNFLYDVTDGQVMLNRVTIFDNAEHWEEPDIRVYVRNDLTPQSHVPDPGDPYIACIEWPNDNRQDPFIIRLPRIYYANIAPVTLKYVNDHGIDWTVETIDLPAPYPTQTVTPYRGLVHEFAHYAWGFHDEYWRYKFIDGKWDWVPEFEPVDRYGLMNFTYTASEMSWNNDYSSPEYQNTKQFIYDRINGNGAPCWNWFEYLFQKPYDAIGGATTWMVSPNSPTDWQPIPDRGTVCDGPNQENYDEGAPVNVGAQLIVRDMTTNTGVFDATVVVKRSVFGPDDPYPTPVGGAIIEVGRAPKPGMREGITANDGKLKCLGLNLLNTVSVFCDGRKRELYLENQQGEYLVILDSWAKTPTPICGEIRREFGAGKAMGLTGNLEIILYAGRKLTDSTTVVAELSNGQSVNVPIVNIPGTLTYMGTIHADSSLTGTVRITAPDTSGSVNSSLGTFVIEGISPIQFHSLCNQKEDFEVLVPEGAVSQPDTVVIFSLETHTAPLTGNNMLNSPVFSINMLSGLTNFANSPRIQFNYSNSDSMGYFKDEKTLELFRWNSALSNWVPLNCELDTSQNTISAQIESPGVFAAFITCRKGDVNNDSSVSVSDVVYLINYLFKGGPPPIPRIDAGDVNISSKVTVSDVVYLVNYLFKGGPPPIC